MPSPMPLVEPVTRDTLPVQRPSPLFKAKRRLDIHGLILPAMEAQCAVQLSRICTADGSTGNAGWLNQGIDAGYGAYRHSVFLKSGMTRAFISVRL